MLLFHMALRQEHDVVLCRNHARTLAASLEFPVPEQTRIATAVSEIARNAFRYAHNGTAEFSLEPADTPQSLVITIRDRGAGIPHLPQILAGEYQSTTGMGMGIIGARRLLDEVAFDTSANGTTVRLARRLPKGVRVELTKVKKLAEELHGTGVINPLDELTEQNRELLITLDECTQQREEVAKINEELSETNRGVVALYDELDTVHRVGRVVAEKLDMASLLQAITDATTEVSGAEVGAFYYCETEGANLTRLAVAGPMIAMLEGTPPTDLDRLLGGVERAEMYRVNDLEAADSPPRPLGPSVPIRSYLAVAVCDSNGNATACLVFGHRMPDMFTERTERILKTVAVQASIGLENARLYHSVQSASAAKDQFLAMLSHELRTPLNPVFAVLAGLEQNTDLSEEVRSDLLVMRRNLQLEAHLIDDLLDITRIVKGKIPLHREVVDVHGIIRMAYETCMGAAGEHDIDVDWQLAAARHHALVDAARLQQVFWNLLNNAVKFTPAHGRIAISTTNDAEGTLCISIADTGHGIAEDALRRIFQPFEQGSATIPMQFGGLGLGLAISRNILDAHGGSIRAESGGVGQGATFVVALPLVNEPEGAGVPAQAVPQVPPVRSGVRILLVDDHADTRTSLQRLLKRRGYEVTLAGSCREALAQAEAHEFDLVISDLGLPDGSGHDLIQNLQAAHGRVPGIALSGYGMETDLARSRAAGFAVHLIKPLDFGALEAAIQQVLGSGSEERQSDREQVG